MTDRVNNCARCGAAWQISATDLQFYQRMSPLIAGQRIELPPPTLCYECRQQRKLSYRNERNLYSRRCDLTGEAMLSVHAADSGLTVYSHKSWYSDQWEGLEFGRDFDFSRPFFEQFHELRTSVPHCSLDVKTGNENCDFIHLGSRNKNCYFVFAASANEDSLYSTFLQRNKDIVDCYFIFESERCYQCIDCYNCYNVRHSQYVQNCSDSDYLYNCKSCSNCFGCVSLVSKSYHIFNKPYSKEEYQRHIETLRRDPAVFAKAIKEVARLRRSSPQKYYAGVSNESVTGDHVSFSRNTFHSFDCTYLEDCKYCTWMHKSKDCYDCYGWGLGGELGYESHLIGDTFFHMLFCESCWDSVSHLMYCRYCVQQCKHLFGCVGLKRKEYCILNKQYSKAEYEQLLPRIIAHMRETGEWGEFFPERHSPFAYNETVAQEYYPLTQAEVEERGWRWKTDIPFPSGKETTSVDKLPSNPAELDDAITKEVFACEECRRNYRMTSMELKFYRSMELALPRHCFPCRHRARWKRRNARVLHQRTCENCQGSILSTYSPQQPEKVFCEDCYHKAVY